MKTREAVGVEITHGMLEHIRDFSNLGDVSNNVCIMQTKFRENFKNIRIFRFKIISNEIT